MIRSGNALTFLDRVYSKRKVPAQHQQIPGGRYISASRSRAFEDRVGPYRYSACSVPRQCADIASLDWRTYCHVG